MSRFRLHYKNKPYRLLGRARHSETLEWVTLYECLYPNDMGTLWVRPEGMFHESVDLPQGRIARFREVPLEIKFSETVTDELWAATEPIMRKIFGNAVRADVEKKLKEHGGGSLLVGFFEGDPVGFKLGYWKDKTTFASWLGGVREDRRGVGVATGLLRAQHQWAYDHGARLITTKSMNKWPEMISLNLRAGFRIVGTEMKEWGLQVLFEKALDARPE